MKFFSLFFIFLLAAPFLFAQQVHTFVDKDSIRVGEQFELTYLVQGSYEGLTYPSEDDFGEDLEVLSRQRYQTASRADSIVYRIQFFATEDITLPSKEIILHRSESDTTLTTSRVPLFFKSVLASEDEEFRPLKPIFDFARSIWPVILALLLLAVAGWLVYRWYTRREPEREPVAPPPPPEPFSDPLLELRDQLGTLPEPHRLETFEEFEQFYIRLGDAIRRYLKRVHDIPALEMTTGEITRALQQENAPFLMIKITRNVLNQADMVKFANFKPDQDHAGEVLSKAQEFADTAAVNDNDRIDYMRRQYEEKHQPAEIELGGEAES